MNESGFGTFVTDRALLVLQWSEWLAQASGIPAQQAEGTPLAELLPDLAVRGLLDRFNDVIANGTVAVLSPKLHRFLVPCAPPSGAERYSQMQQRVTILPLREEEEIHGTLVTIEDVTLRLEREDQLSRELASGDKFTRLHAAQELAAEMENGETHPALFAALDDESWQVRWVATDSVKISKDNIDTLNLVMDALRTRHHDPGILNSIIKVLARSQINVVRPLVNLLRTSQDNDLRIYVALILGELRNPQSVPALLGLLSDPDPNVVYHAIESLGKLRSPEATIPLSRFLVAGDFFLGFAALEALGRIGDGRAVAAIATLLNDEMMGTGAVEALGLVGHPDGILPLVEKLNAQPEWSEPIVGALVRIHTKAIDVFGSGAVVRKLAQPLLTPATQRHLLAALPTATGDYLRNLVVVLGWLEGRGVEEALVSLIQMPDLRKEVIEALVRQGSQVTAMLTRIIETGNEESRKATVQALGRIGDRNAVAVLLQHLGQDDELTITIAGALAQIGDTSAFEALLQNLRTPSRPVRQALIGAINSLGHPDMAERIAEAIADPDAYLRESAVRIACYFAFPNCFALVLASCTDDNEDVSEAALEGIVYFEDEPEQILAALGAGMQHKSSKLRSAAARGLAYVPSRRAWPRLVAALDDPSMWVRYYAVRSLGQLRTPEASEILIERLRSDEAPPVRIAMLDALGQIGGVHSIAALGIFVHSEDDDLARAALTALGNLSHPHALPPILNVLNSPHPERRLIAIESLGRWNDEQVVPNLARMLHPTVPTEERLAAVRSLSTLSGPDAVTVLVDATADGELREEAIAALSRIDLDLLDVLDMGLDHPNGAVQRAVAESLARRRHPLATKTLANRLATGNDSLQNAVAAALERSSLALLADNRVGLLWQG